KVGSIIRVGDKEMKIAEVDVIRRKLKVKMKNVEGIEIIKEYDPEEVEVIEEVEEEEKSYEEELFKEDLE
ncbi:MAG: stage 0 sporulation protein, partial [Caldanaerobacter sp.]